MNKMKSLKKILTPKKPTGEDLVIPNFTVPQLFLAAARTYPERIALDFMGHQTTYAHFAKQVQEVAAGLQLLGVGKGTRVALMLPNTPHYAIFYQAILLAGGVVLNLNPLYTAPELTHLLRLTNTTIVVSLDLPEHLKKLQEVSDAAHLTHIIACPLAPYLPGMKSMAYRALQLLHRKALKHPLITSAAHLHALPSGFHVPEVKPQDLAVLQPTGGTTGTPKAARLTHTNLVANTTQSRSLLGQTRPDGESFLCLLPFFHVFANTALLNLGLAIGATLVLLPRFEAKAFLSTIRRTRPTIMGVVPSLLSSLTENRKAKKEDLSSFRYLISGGAPLPVKIAERFTAKFGHPVHEGYGLTEASPVVACNPPGGIRAGTVGTLLPGTKAKLLSLDDPKKEAGPGQSGHLLISGPQVMQGYDNAPEETAKVLQKGWLHTGDIATLSADGYLTITDRSKDIIIVNGFKVFPRQVEDALLTHPDVAEALVIPHAHESKGQVPHAYVRLIEGSHLTGEALQGYSASRLNPLARPAVVFVRESLPKTPLGKPCRKTLIAEVTKKGF